MWSDGCLEIREGVHAVSDGDQVAQVGGKVRPMLADQDHAATHSPGEAGFVNHIGIEAGNIGYTEVGP